MIPLWRHRVGMVEEGPGTHLLNMAQTVFDNAIGRPITLFVSQMPILSKVVANGNGMAIVHTEQDNGYLARQLHDQNYFGRKYLPRVKGSRVLFSAVNALRAGRDEFFAMTELYIWRFAGKRRRNLETEKF